MEKPRVGYHGTPSALARWQMKIASEAREAQAEAEKPMYWVNSKGLTQEVWEGVIDVYASVFAQGQEVVEKPTFTELSSVFTPTGGEITFTPTGSMNLPLEVRTKISGHELFLRFKAYVSSPSTYPEKREAFQNKVEEYLKAQGLELVPHTEIC